MVAEGVFCGGWGRSEGSDKLKVYVQGGFVLVEDLGFADFAL